MCGGRAVEEGREKKREEGRGREKKGEEGRRREKKEGGDI